MSAARIHCLVSLALLAVFALLCGAMDTASRSQRVANWIDDQAAARYQRVDRAFLRGRNYGDFFERLMLDEVPNTDYSRGGAYVMGSSNVVFCAEFDTLSPPQRQLIHNFGFPGADPQEILQLVQYVTDQQRWLRAGGDKTAVLICLNYTDLLETTTQLTGAGGFLPPYLNGSGLFLYDPSYGITQAPMQPWERKFLLRRNRWRSFAHRLERFAERVQPMRADPKALRAAAEKASAAGESVEHSTQWARLDQLLDYLQSRDVRTTLLIMPTGSWYRGLPAEEYFMRRLPQIADMRHIPLIDLSLLLPDDEFMDHHHATAQGAVKVHAILLKWAVDQLHATGALSAGVTQ